MNIGAGVGPRPPIPGSPSPARQHQLKERNLALVLGQIAEVDRSSRAQIASQTGLTRATVSSLTDSLIDAGLVIELDPQRGVVGRPGNPLSLNPHGPAGLGLEINVDYISASVVDLRGVVRASRTIRGDNRVPSPSHILARSARLARHVISQAEHSGLVVVGMCVAVPGLVDLDGVLRRAPNLVKWQGIPVAVELGERIGRMFHVVHCDNEANLAALGERWFGLRITSDFVLVSGEIGVGAGIVVNGELYRGVRGVGGELGHLTVYPDGPSCTCGGRGCLEKFAGQEALLAAAGMPSRVWTAIGNPTGPIGALVQRAKQGNIPVLSALDRAGHALGIALSSFINLMDLPVAVLGGLYADLAPWFIDPILTELRARVVSAKWAPVELLISSLGTNAAVRGAAGVTIRRILDDPTSYLPQEAVSLP